MEVIPGVFIAAAAFVLILGGIYLHQRAKKKRREELASLADELGWTFHPERDKWHDRAYPQFAAFGRGHTRSAYNTMKGQLKIGNRVYPAVMGDYTYKVTRSNGKTTITQTYHFSYLILHLPFRGVPDLLIRRENMLDKIAGAFGFADINFESSEFSRKFHVKSADKRFAYDVIHPRMMEFLLNTFPAAIHIESGKFLLTDGNDRWAAEEFQSKLTWAERFFDQWPDHLTAALDHR